MEAGFAIISWITLLDISGEDESVYSLHWCQPFEDLFPSSTETVVNFESVLVVEIDTERVHLVNWISVLLLDSVHHVF